MAKKHWLVEKAYRYTRSGRLVTDGWDVIESADGWDWQWCQRYPRKRDAEAAVAALRHEQRVGGPSRNDAEAAVVDYVCAGR